MMGIGQSMNCRHTACYFSFLQHESEASTAIISGLLPIVLLQCNYYISRINNNNKGKPSKKNEWIIKENKINQLEAQGKSMEVSSERPDQRVQFTRRKGGLKTMSLVIDRYDP